MIDVIVIFNNNGDNLKFLKTKQMFLKYTHHDCNFTHIRGTQDVIVDFLNTQIENSKADLTVLFNTDLIINKSFDVYLDKLKELDFELAGTVQNMPYKHCLYDITFKIEETPTNIDTNCCIIKNKNFRKIKQIEESLMETLNYTLTKHIVLPYLYCDNSCLNVIDFENCCVSKIEDRNNNPKSFPAFVFLEEYDKDLFDIKSKYMLKDDYIESEHRFIIDQMITSNVKCTKSLQSQIKNT